MQPLRQYSVLFQHHLLQPRWIAALLFTLLLAACAPVQPVSPADQPAATATEASTEEATAETTATSAEESAFPVTIENCGIETTYTEAPTSAVTMNQAATEIMLSLGLEGSMVGTAYLDDAILPEFETAYESIPFLADEYPSQEVLLASEPDFVYGSYSSAFGDEAAGSREQLSELDIQSYLSVAACEDTALRPEKVTFDTLFGEILDIGRIFGVEDRAQVLVDSMQAQLDDVTATVGEVAEPLTVFWYDSETEAPFSGACCGVPAMIMEAAGGENILSDAPGTWATVTWEEVVDRNPQAVVLADAEWSTADEKMEYMLTDPALVSIVAVQNEHFIPIPFSATSLGIRNVEAVEIVAKGLYPEKFE